LAGKPELVEQLQQAGQTLTQNDLSFHVTTKPLQARVHASRLASDRIDMSFRQKIAAGKYQLRTALRQLLWRSGLSGRR
jgi:hypothetical protein